MRKVSLLLFMLLFSLQIHAATEAQLACNLERSKAEVEATVLSAPAAFVSLGDAATTEKNLAIGISQSMSGRSRADTLREAASAKCGALTATLELDEQARWNILQIQQDSAKTELAGIDEAIGMAAINLSTLDAQLAASTITIADHTEARQALASLELRRAELKRIIATTVLLVPHVGVKDLIVQAERQEAKAAALTAKASADSGWDVVVSAGMRQPISNGNATPFVSLSAKYSFGLEASRQASRDVGRNTQLLMEAQQAGYSKTSSRQAQDVTKLIEVERAAASTAHSELDQVQRIYASMHGLDTVLALNTTRSLALQMKTLEAQIAGDEARLHGYETLLETLK